MDYTLKPGIMTHNHANAGLFKHKSYGLKGSPCIIKGQPS